VSFGDTKRFRAILLVVFMSLAAGLYVFADRLALQTEQEGLHRLARSQAGLIISFRNFYSSRLLPIVREHSQLTITHDYKNQPAALPIPATLTLDLVDDIAKLHPEMNLRLISPYPFPWRKVQLEPFDLEAMAALQASTNDEFMRLDDAPDGKVLRYAAPIRLAASCVGCHNSHPDSPKRDWKEGDVRGIQVMKLPLEGLTYNSHPKYYLLATLLLLAFGVAGGVLIRLHGRGVEALHLAQNSADGLRERQHALDAHAIVSIADKAGRIIYANDQFCAISGFSREELLGQTHRLLKSGTHPDTFYADMWSTIARGDVWQGEVCNRNKAGGQYWVKSTMYPFLDAKGKPYQYIAIRTDITERKAVEGELIAKRAEAEAASRAKGDFLANMSHEIRTPMNGIIGMSDLALDAQTEDERQEYMKIVKSSAESLLGILNDILDFSKIEANKLMLERVGFDLRQTVSETLKTLGPRASQKGLELICDIASDVPQHVLGDPTRLRQVLINLTGNAIKFTDRGEIVISLAVEARTEGSVMLQVAVRDSGIGIPADKLDSIFEAFSQADASTTRQYGGTGLGLSISSRLVELMGGKMSVDSEPGKGSTFQFTLALGVDGTPTRPLATEQLAGKKVLVVDDNAVNREIFLRQLTRWGMKAFAASSGAQAQAMCGSSECQPDLVLIDQHMPQMDGLSLAAWMRTQTHLRTTPLLILSSGPLRDDTERTSDLQLRGYLTKPVTDNDLLGAVRRALGLSESSGTPGRPGLSQMHGGEALRVLVVEDNPINQQLAMRLLTKWGHDVTLAVNGQEAVDHLVGDHRYDIVLMDMQMPVMGGIDSTRLIRAHETEHAKKRVPIMAMTANAMQGDREACLAAGMDDYLSKPINQHELAEKLRIFTPASSLGGQAGLPDSEPGVGSPAPAFDYGAAAAAMDQEMMEILTPAFLSLYQGELDSLRQAIATGDTEDAMRTAHGLKGTLAAFGAQPAERCAAEMEALSQAGQLAALPALLDVLDSEVSKLVAVLRT
jgi:PAS domain S-box-containing protein